MFVIRQIAVASALAAAQGSALSSALPSAAGGSGNSSAGTRHLFSPITSLAVEKLEIGAKSIAPEPLTGRLELSLRPDARGGARSLEGKSRFCPHLIANSEMLTLRCTTQRFSATLDPKSGAVTLVELRGVPWRADDDGPPRWSYDPEAMAHPLVCPGATAAAKAECLFQAGQLDRAFAEFSALLDGPNRGFASLRLGDIALALEDPERALAAYERAGKPGSPVVALAALRRCELIDDCSPIVLDPLGYPEAQRAEARLRIARQLAFHGRWTEVLTLLSRMPTTPIGSAANRDEELRLRRRLLIGALIVPESASGGSDARASQDDDDRLTQALELYLNDPNRLTGRYAEELTDAAAEAADHLGTARFGAHILAAIFPEVAARHRAGHLLRTAEMYLEDEDAAHAEAIFEFARTRLPASELRAPRWRQVGRRLKQFGNVHADEILTERLKRDVQLASEISEAVHVTSTARKAQEGNP